MAAERVEDDDARGLHLNLGCGRNPLPGHCNIDSTDLPGVDLIADLDTPFGAAITLPWRDDAVSGVVSSHMIEHIRHPLPLMQELWRISKPDALAIFACPYGSSDDADENPTHVRRMFLGSWVFFGQPYYWREDYGYTGDWQTEVIHLRLKPGVWDQAGHDPEKVHQLVSRQRNIVGEQVAVLRCQKPARAADRELQSGYQIVLEDSVPVDQWTYSNVEVARLEIGLP